MVGRLQCINTEEHDMSLAAVGMNELATHVLAVDDSAADRNLLRLSLLGSSYCYKLECAKRLSEGLAKLGNQRADVVLLDLNLPDSQGKRTVEKVMEHAAHVPVLVLTGSDDEGMALEAMRAGAQDYIVKGQIDSLSLSRAMRYAIERHRMLMASRQDRQRQFGSKEGLATYGSATTLSAGSLQYAQVAGPTGSLHDSERRSDAGDCIMKSRKGYQGFVIEARVHKQKDSQLTAEITIENHDSDGVTAKQFYIPSTFAAPGLAVEIAMQTGRERIDEGLWVRHRRRTNS
jgi:DNA-binding NarL/FixJ family response regulator